MNFRNISLGLTLMILSSCAVSRMNNYDIESTGITVVKAHFLQSNFSALLESKELYYLEHMSITYDPHGPEFWKISDTVNLGNGIINRRRQGACQPLGDNSGYTFCLEQQEHIIDQKNNKVLKFNGAGSGYWARIEFIYDDSQRLVAYKNGYETYSLKYNKLGGLKEVVISTLVDGKTLNNGLIVFK